MVPGPGLGSAANGIIASDDTKTRKHVRAVSMGNWMEQWDCVNGGFGGKTTFAKDILSNSIDFWGGPIQRKTALSVSRRRPFGEDVHAVGRTGTGCGASRFDACTTTRAGPGRALDPAASLRGSGVVKERTGYQWWMARADLNC